MGKKNSKLKDDTLDQLCADTYCKYKRMNKNAIHTDFIFVAFLPVH